MHELCVWIAYRNVCVMFMDGNSAAICMDGSRGRERLLLELIDPGLNRPSA